MADQLCFFMCPSGNNYQCERCKEIKPTNLRYLNLTAKFHAVYQTEKLLSQFYNYMYSVSGWGRAQSVSLLAPPVSPTIVRSEIREDFFDVENSPKNQGRTTLKT